MVIQDGVIAAVVPSAEADVQVTGRVIDGKNGYLIPGLIDTHVHLDHPQLLSVFPAWGVTTVVNMRGRPSHLALRQRPTPTITADFVSAGDYIDGNPPNMLPMSFVETPEDAATLVRHQIRQGFDFLKIYSELSRPQFQAICQAAKELGVAVAGHIPDSVGLDDLKECPLVNIAHGEQLEKIIDSYDDTSLENLARELRSANQTVTANGALMIAMSKQPEALDELLAQPYQPLLHPSLLQAWRPGFNRYQRRDQAWVGRIRAANERLAKAIPFLSQAQVLVAGTDTPVAGAWPGQSLHEELIWLTSTGISRAAALDAATVHAGRLVERLSPARDPVGQVRPGFQADLVLLDRNPLEDLSNLGSVSGIMLNGRWFTHGEIDEHLEKIRSRNRDLAPMVSQFERGLFANDPQAMDEAQQTSGGDQLLAQYPAFFIARGWLLDSREELRLRALDLFRRYTTMYPDVHSAHFMLGEALASQGDLQGARAAWQKSLELHPWYPPARARLTLE
ncbi:MAG: amidohydrolase family protein [Pseudomonadota bacterium]